MASEAQKTNLLRQRLREPKATPGLAAIPCWKFFPIVLGIELTPAQSLLVKVCVDGLGQESLSKEELELFPLLFGLPVGTTFPVSVRKLILLLLGRGSGKSLLCAGIAIYLSLTISCKGAGPGQIPVFICVAPDKSTAISVTLSTVRALTIDNPKLAAFVSDKGDDYVELLRPDGNRVRITAVAADKGGRNTRGRDILGFILEEAQFFNSDPSGRYIVNDRDVYRAMTPRFMPGARGFFVSTPWPTENMMAEEITKNFAHPVTCLAAIAPTELMRPDNPQLQEIIREERIRDPENAKREFDCDTNAVSIGTFFDPASLRASVRDPDHLEFLDPTKYPVACGVDFAFKRDSSTICIVQFDGKHYRTVYMEELIPKEGVPLKPSEVVEHFSRIARDHGLTYVIADGHYRESMKEALLAQNLGLVPAPEGGTGKEATYLRTKAMLDDGKILLPESARFQAQASAVVAKPTVGGHLSIKVPRKTGFGHGDLVSSWVLAVHHLSYSKVVERMQRPMPGQEGYKAWFAAKLQSKAEKAEERYIREAEAELSTKKKWRYS